MFFSKPYHRLSTKWEVGFVALDEKIFSQEKLNVKWLKHRVTDRWFADPQIVSHDNNLIKVLVEDFTYNIDRGRISMLYVDADSYELIGMKEILTLDTHLSFPIILRDNNATYIYPENGQSGVLKCYRLDTDSDSIVGEGIIISKEKLADAVIVPELNAMLATSVNPNGNILDVLRRNVESGLFEKSTVLRFKDNVARNAGPCFRLGEKLIRPAQICTNSYGEGVELQEIQIHDEEITFNPIVRIKSPHPKHKLAFHTFCVNDGLVAVDCMGYSFWFSPILEKLRSFV